MEKTYAFVGSWSLRGGTMGLSVYSYDLDTADMKWIKTVHEEIAVGNQYLDRERGILYITDESGSPRGETVGGYVQAFSLGGREILKELNGRETLLPKPSYFCLDKSKKYALISHHSNRGKVTKLVCRGDGAFGSETVTDDAGLVLIEVLADGSLGQVRDVVLTPGEEPFGPYGLSHEHCVNMDPSGKLFLVCDKGMDRIYSFHLDREKGKLALIHTTQVEKGYAPRYAVFHPTLPVVYENNEHQPVVNIYHYEADTGVLKLLEGIRLTEEAGEGTQSADLVMNPEGSILYASVRGADQIIVLEIDDTGLLHKKQTVASGGENPRGLCLDPAGRFLLCANIGSNCIARFLVQEDGTLLPAGDAVAASIPGNITIASVKE